MVSAAEIQAAPGLATWRTRRGRHSNCILRYCCISGHTPVRVLYTSWFKLSRLGAWRYGYTTKAAALRGRLAPFLSDSYQLGGGQRYREGIEPIFLVSEFLPAFSGWCVTVFLEISPAAYSELAAHLLPATDNREQAAFLFVDPVHARGRDVFRIKDKYKAAGSDFTVQASDYLELADNTRARLIKRAHDLGTSLVELHSHRGAWPAAFSLSDCIGLRDTVPHMWWRLKHRPYLAIVVTMSGFDALLWLHSSKTPCALDGLIVGRDVIIPTNYSLENWNDGSSC